MKKWVYIQILFIVWSFYLLIIHMSNKDHIIMKILLFIWFFTIAFYIGKTFRFHPGLRVFYVFLSYGCIYLGHLWFSQMVI
ncbi:hypothetical protein EDD68_10855 [Melghiribacillus thermohalophilus]|uniref:Uncharacterized protein n=1 Tax=Melghiribacillus thermohalophilus TaxID=1324956 RepID=A0A4R3N1D4_9BACI|nr:hypothetical protein EDD68_10855 [Melghiribacillus thermohalophilus]